METPDGQGRLELTKFQAPSSRGGDGHALANTPGLRHVSFEGDDIDAVVASVQPPARSSLARWRTTKTSIGSATSAARRGSSWNWRSGSAKGSGRRPTASPASVVVPRRIPIRHATRGPSERAGATYARDPRHATCARQEPVRDVARGRLVTAVSDPDGNVSRAASRRVCRSTASGAPGLAAPPSLADELAGVVGSVGA